MTDPAGERPVWAIPLEEWDRMNADLPPSDTRPLDDGELKALRERLDAPGGGRLALSLREHMAYYERLAIVRSPERVEALVRQVRSEARADPKQGLAYPRGILDAVRWATGERREGPVTDDVPEGAKPRMVELMREEDAAQEILRWQRSTIHPRDYVVGVEATLLWLRAGCDDPPW